MSGIDRRSALRLFGAVGVAGLASACGTTDAAIEPELEREDPVRIGLLVPTTGGYRQIGDEIVNGFRRYLQVSGGRLGGHPVTEVTEDEGDSPETAGEALQRLLDQDVHAVVGMVSSAAILELSQAVEEAFVPLVSANASPQELTGNPYIWRTSYVNHEPGLAIGEHMVTAVNGSVAIIAQDDPLGRDGVAGLQEAFAAAQQSDRLAEPIFTAEQSEPGEDYFAAELDSLRLSDPSAVFCVYAGVAAAEFVRQYVAAGLDPERLYAPAYLTEGSVLTEIGQDALGIHTAANYASELRGAANRSFAVGYRSSFGSPTTYAVAGYDAAAVLDTAVRLTGGDPSPRQINLTLGEVGLVDSPRGRWQFNQNRTPTQKWYLREVALDGPVVANMVIQQLGTLG